MDKGQDLEQAGASAATQLEDVIRDRLRKQDMGHRDIVVHVYANVSSLSQLVAKAGRYGSERCAFGPLWQDSIATTAISTLSMPVIVKKMRIPR